MTPTIVLLPGLGGDYRLFESQRAAFPNLIVPPWPLVQPGDSLSAFAGRLVEAIPASNCLYVGGASFGGMVALELAARIQPRGVILIGSCSTPSSIAPLVRNLRVLAQALPVSSFHPRRWTLPLVLPKFGRLTSEQRELFWSMATATQASFLKWGVGAILSWRPAAAGSPIYHIHGGDDRLIPPRLVRPDRVVPGGGHLLTLTHPREVNEFISEVLEGSGR